MTGKGNPPKYLDHSTTIWFASDFRKPQHKSGLRPFGWVALHAASDEEVRSGRKFEEMQNREREAQLQARLDRRLEVAGKRAEVAERRRILVLERERAEAEARDFPWRPWLRSIAVLEDWGAFRQQVLDNEQAAQWRNEQGVAEGVLALACRVRDIRPEKWSADRDELTAAWLASTQVEWQPAEEQF
jgi:hypothetical protein